MKMDAEFSLQGKKKTSGKRITGFQVGYFFHTNFFCSLLPFSLFLYKIIDKWVLILYDYFFSFRPVTRPNYWLLLPIHMSAYSLESMSSTNSRVSSSYMLSLYENILECIPPVPNSSSVASYNLSLGLV
jgi:hypothetical protein